MFRIVVALLLALVWVDRALAQPAPPAAANASGKPPAAAKPAAKKPAPPKPGAARQPAAQLPSGPCIGVIPVVSGFAVQRIGVTVFGNEYKELPVPSWGLDELVVQRVRAAAGPRVAVRRIAYAKDAFVPYEHPEPALFRDREKDLAAIVQKIAASAGCARYVVVTKAWSAYANTNQAVGGIGVLNHGFSLINRTYLFAISYIRVYDGRSFAVLKGRASGLTSQDGPFAYFSSQIRGPYRELEDFAWPEQPEATLTLAMRNGARAVLAQSLDKTLPELLAP